jgi:hypothetical protein
MAKIIIVFALFALFLVAFAQVDDDEDDDGKLIIVIYI